MSDQLETEERVTLQAATTHALQGAIWPEAGINTEVHAHFELWGPVGLSQTDGRADFAPGGWLSSNAYYNVFNLGKWRRNAGYLPIELQLTGHGRFLLVVNVMRRNESTDRIVSEIISLDGVFRQEIDPSASLRGGAVLTFELTALDHGTLDYFAWVTTQAPRTTPDLMLSVTTFRREAEVADTIERFRAFRAESPLRDHIRMTVVDNGQTVDVASGDGVTIIPNENLGGAGGFTRGLLEARLTGATHCLFMDDDASIQMEALSRTWAFLAYALDPRTAVAGGMINGTERWQMWENGARFELGCRPLFGGLDLRNSHAVLAMEFDSAAPPPDDLYGGWWFFAFPVAQADHLPFPFFVRGDDVSFSLVNDFNIVTLPGVASVQESFTAKSSPLNWYLDFRSHLVHHLTVPEKERTWGELQRMVVNFYLRTVLRFHYESLSAVNLALEDVLRGPAFFDENADLAQRRADLKALTVTEAWHPIDAAPPVRLGRLPRPLRALSLLTLNGHLLPVSDRFGSKLVLSIPFREDHRKTYGAAEMTYLNSDQTAAYVVRRDRKRFWQESVRLLKNSLRLRRQYSRMMNKWRKGYSEMTSDAYWTQRLRLPAD